MNFPAIDPDQKDEPCEGADFDDEILEENEDVFIDEEEAA
jgi:hypothetical protein